MPSLCYVKSSPYGLLSYLLYDPQGAASCLLTPSNARWVTATNLLPSLPILHTRQACVSEGLTATWQYRNPCLKNVGSKTNKSYRTSQVNYIIANRSRDYNCKFWQKPIFTQLCSSAIPAPLLSGKEPLSHKPSAGNHAATPLWYRSGIVRR